MQNAPSNLNIPFFCKLFICYWTATSTPSNPRDENFCQMLKNSLCPKLKLFSLTTVIVIIITSLYISMLGIYGINKYDCKSVKYNF